MEKLFDLYVDIKEEIGVKGKTRGINMVSFIGKAEGTYFNGNVIGTGVDTQVSSPEGKWFLSARYMLEGTDIDGERCRIFIENNGSLEIGLTPRIVTDSKALSKFETAELKAELSPMEGGVIVSVWG
ncbi:MAG: DUF3237 family protein [Oscillospiraceae bacterium]|nr:DUF3237 family protein [Oscillospiraceae bacterium]